MHSTFRTLPGPRFARRLASVVLVCVIASTSLQAQGLPQIDIRLPTGTTSSTVSVRNVLPERSFDELLRNGFPARLHIRSEVWTIGRWFDEIVGSVEWDIIMRHDLIDHTYDVARVTRDGITPLGTYAQFADARAATELPFTSPLVPRARGQKGYIAVQVDVQTVEMSDLDEVQRWLRGEARPAVQGRRSPGTALTRGLRTLVSRILGGEVRHLEARTPTLRF